MLYDEALKIVEAYEDIVSKGHEPFQKEYLVGSLKSMLASALSEPEFALRYMKEKIKKETK